MCCSEQWDSVQIKIGLWYNCSNILQGPRWTPDFNPTEQDFYLRTTLKAKRPTKEQQLKAASGLPKHFWGGNSIFGDIRLFQTWHFSLYFKNIFIASWTLCIEGKIVSLSKHKDTQLWMEFCHTIVCVCVHTIIIEKEHARNCVLIIFFLTIYFSFFLPYTFLDKTDPSLWIQTGRFSKYLYSFCFVWILYTWLNDTWNALRIKETWK